MPPRTVAIVTFDRFNELDSLIALHLLGRVKEHGIAAEIASPTETVTSMNGVRISGARPLEWASEADPRGEVLHTGLGARARSDPLRGAGG
jgi:hypothetical protein